MATAQRSLNRPPPHLQGNLVFHKTWKLGIPRPKRGFFVLLKTVIHRYDSKDAYHKGRKSAKEYEIQLDEVCGITEVLFPSKQYKNCSFSVILSNGTEYIFSAESREEMEQWVNGLRIAKEFWAQHYKWEKKQKFRQNLAHLNQTVVVQNEVAKSEHSVCGTSTVDEKHIAQLHVTTWDGRIHKLLLPLVFDAEELLSLLGGKIHVQGTGTAACPTCKLQQSSMEIWIVTENGIGQKLDHKGDPLDVSKHGRHFYLLVHNYKLLIVHFEDGTFEVRPCLVSLKAKEVPHLPVFADKVSSLGLSNFGLFLLNDSGTSMPFDPEEQPLKHSFHGRLLLKERVLTVSSPISPNRLDIQIQQRKKAQQNAKNMKALKKVEHQKCKQNSEFPWKKTKNRALISPRELMFQFDYYDVTDDENKLHVNCTDSKHNMQNGDSHKFCSIEFNSVEQEQRFSQGRSLFQEKGSDIVNRDKCFVPDRNTNSGLEVKAGDEFNNGLPVFSTERFKGIAVHENGETIDNNNSYAMSENVKVPCLPQMSSGLVLLESLKPPERPPEIGGQCDKMEQSIEMEDSYPPVRKHFCEDNGALSTRGEPSLTGNGCQESDITLEGVPIRSAEGQETQNQRNLANSEFVNHQSSGPTNADNVSFERQCPVTEGEISALTNHFSGGDSIKDQWVERNDESTVSKNTSEREPRAECHLSDDEIAPSNTDIDDDASVESYFSASEDDVPSHNFGENNFRTNWTDRACNDSTLLSYKEAPSHRTIIANPGELIEQDNSAVPKVCKERPHIEIHQCDYTIVGSPCVLELVLKVCSGQKMGEEEVGESNMFTKICLSGWHLLCENGAWSIVQRGRVLSYISDSVSSTVKVQLTRNLEAVFHKEEKLWTIIENVDDVDKSLVSANPAEDQTWNGALGILTKALDNLGDESNSDMNVLLDKKLQGNATFNSKSFVVESAVQDQSHSATLNVPDESTREQEKAFKTNSGVKIFSSAKESQVDIFETRAEKNKHCEKHPSSGLPNSTAKHTPEKALHAAIQGIFHHIYKFNETPEEALSDRKHEGIFEDVCEPLCKALWNILSVGLRKKRFLGKYTVWNLVENFKDVSSHVREIVDWVNNRYAFLGESQKFQAFVCECLNIRHGTLHQWLESLLSQKEKLACYYGEAALVFHLPHAKLEELVGDLSRISFLPFELHSDSWIKKHHYYQHSPAFAFE